MSALCICVYNLDTLFHMPKKIWEKEYNNMTDVILECGFGPWTLLYLPIFSSGRDMIDLMLAMTMEKGLCG